MKSKAVARRRADVQAKALTIAGVTWDFMPAGTSFNYSAKVGDGLKSSVLVALLSWLMRTFPEAPAVVERREQERWSMQWNHPLAARIRQPNKYYSGRVLWMATVLEFAFGNAYWRKVRNGFGEVVELWWIPSALIKPVWDDVLWPNTFIHHYEIKSPKGEPEKLRVEDVIHFRFGMHPDDQRIGFTPLTAMVREIYVDDQASNFTASILRNLGILGLVFSPKTAGTGIPPGKLDDFKKYVQENFTGDKRGQAMAFSQPIDAQVLQYNLQGFDVGPIRDIAEERLSAALGIPAAVVGFGTGLQQTKVGATMRELIGQAWNACIMPMQAILAEELDRSLLPDFQKNTDIYRVQFDTSDVRALREDENQKSMRLSDLMSHGIITLAEGRQQLGFEVKPEHEVYYRPTGIVAVKKPDAPPEPATTYVIDPATGQAPPVNSGASPIPAPTPKKEPANAAA